MPYQSNSDLPGPIKTALPSAAQTVYRTVANEYLDKDPKDEAKAASAAWAAVKNGWKKNEDGSWVKKSASVMKSTNVQVIKVDEKLGIVFGWAIVSTEKGKPYYDLQDQHIPEAVMTKALAGFMKDSRIGGEMHKKDKDGVPVYAGDVVFAFPLTADIAKAMGITTERTGAMIGYKPADSAILGKFASGEYTGFSISGMAGIEDAPDA